MHVFGSPVDFLLPPFFFAIRFLGARLLGEGGWLEIFLEPVGFVVLCCSAAPFASLLGGL